MEAALSAPARVRSLVVADIAPIRYKPAYVDYINSLAGLELDGVTRRSDAGRELEKFIPDRNLRLFFLTNLRKTDDGTFGWRINLEGIRANYDNIWKEIAGDRVYDGPALFLRGGDSDFIRDSYFGLIGEMFPSFSVETVDGAGHWIHTEQPEHFRESVSSFILKNL